MATSTLHLNNPVPSNGAVVSSLGGRHTVTVTLAGVGAISCVVQAWGSEQGTDARKIGAPVTVSGTTTVSQTLTFDADCKQFWLQLVSMSAACKFNATVENDGTIVSDKPIVAPWVTTKLDRLLRIATFGDSTASSIGVGGGIGVGANCDQERMHTPFPGSGSTDYMTWQSTATAHFWIPSLIVATGGIIGQQVQQMLDRSKAAYSATRKALADVLAKRPDVVLFHGASINDYLGMTASTPQATIDAVISKHRQMVEFFTAAGVHVIDTGAYGYSVAGPNLPAVCSIVVQSNATLKTLAASNPYWHFIDTAGITHDGTGLYIPSCTSDGTHLSATGGFRIGQAETEKIDKLFIAGLSGDVIWDQSIDFANATSNNPANTDIGYTPGKSVIVSKVVEPSKLTVVVDVTESDTIQYWVKNTLVAGGALYNALAGDALLGEFWVEVFDSTGAPYLGRGASMRIMFTIAADGRSVYYDRYHGTQTNRPFVRQFSLPVDGSSPGINPQFFHGATLTEPGRYTVVFHPIRIRKYTPLNTLP